MYKIFFKEVGKVSKYFVKTFEISSLIISNNYLYLMKYRESLHFTRIPYRICKLFMHSINLLRKKLQTFSRG